MESWPDRSFYTDKSAPSADAERAEATKAACPPPSRNWPRRATAQGAAGGSGPLLFPHA